ncbi:uncharacterized protein LOC103470766 isoform X2 [Poecilia reticulata]|uniref:uncharacterized protein LOC103470766 isoform X2 n=1 Tax=Poecilia reticulata TaxID=8081 RepID=UPI0004A37D74|nr:PREDICTED: uncharacterized protein LOC103470766 isoform X2 [Poecilia reticulata]
MAGRTASRKSCQLLFILCLLNIGSGFEVREDEWEELRPDVAALHRLTGLSEHLMHQQLSSTRVRRSVSRLDIDQNILSLWDGLQECENMAACVMAKKQDLGALVEHVEKQKTDDWLLRASEISHSYGQKLLIITDQEPSTSERARQE